MAARCGTVAAIVLGAFVCPACDGGRSGGASPHVDSGAGGGAGGAPAPAAMGVARQLRRLSVREYNNVVRDLLGDTSRPADEFVSDSYQNGYDNGSGGLAVDDDRLGCTILNVIGKPAAGFGDEPTCGSFQGL